MKPEANKPSQIRHTPARARKVEKRFGVQLRKISSHIDTIVKGFDLTDESVYPSITSALRRYAATLHDWAVSTAGRILTDIALRDEQTWMEYSADMSRALRDEIRNTPTGEIMRKLQSEQVVLIKSLPLEAAKRIQDKVNENVISGARIDKDLIDFIMSSGDVSRSRANSIARTETSRATGALTQARAEAIGSEGYIWRDMGDSDVRHDHKDLNGKFFRWDSPPIADKRNGARAHPGCIYNCRCYPEPVIPEE